MGVHLRRAWAMILYKRRRRKLMTLFGTCSKIDIHASQRQVLDGPNQCANSEALFLHSQEFVLVLYKRHTVKNAMLALMWYEYFSN